MPLLALKVEEGDPELRNAGCLQKQKSEKMGFPPRVSRKEPSPTDTLIATQ